MLTSFYIEYLYADSSLIIPQANKGMPNRNPIPFNQAMGF